MTLAIGHWLLASGSLNRREDLSSSISCQEPEAKSQRQRKTRRTKNKTENNIKTR
jgi:hypothetical protein